MSDRTGYEIRPPLQEHVGGRNAKHAARLLGLLPDHWLSEMRCDHDTKTDVAVCSCGRWNSGPRVNIGEAVMAWADHVIAAMYACSDEGCEIGQDIQGECAHARNGSALMLAQSALIDATDYGRIGQMTRIPTELYGAA